MMAVKQAEQGVPHVLIVGTGVTGLVIAQGLKRAGIPYTIWESDASLSRTDSDDWSMAVHWSIPFLTSCLDPSLMAEINTSHVDPHYKLPENDVITLRDGHSGEVMKNIPMGKTYRVSRTKFRALCATGIDIQFNKSLVSIDASSSISITIHSADGTTATGSVLIGADGVRSSVRRLLVPGPSGVAISSPYTATRVITRFASAETALHVRSLHPINTMAIHPLGIWAWMSVLDVPDPEDPTSWTFQLMASWPTSSDVPSDNPGDLASLPGFAIPRPRTTLATLQAKMTNFAEPFRTAWASIPPGTVVRSNQTSYWEPPSPPAEAWNNFDGRATLAGDAAHPMTFHRGQGVNHAIVDAANFVKAMKAVKDGEKTSSDVICAYDKEVVARGGEEVRLSLKNTVMLHDWQMVLNSPLMQKGAAKG